MTEFPMQLDLTIVPVEFDDDMTDQLDLGDRINVLTTPAGQLFIAHDCRVITWQGEPVRLRRPVPLDDRYAIRSHHPLTIQPTWVCPHCSLKARITDNRIETS